MCVQKLPAVYSVLFSICLLATPARTETRQASSLKRLSGKDIEAMEAAASVGRNFFLQGRYLKASAVFEELSVDLTVSTPLYLCELGSCYLAAGASKEAKRALLRAADLIEGFFDQHSERTAARLFDAEKKKLFKGDPYERSMLGLFLGLLFLQEGDVDNALACFKNGILCDSDVANEMYKSDFSLLQALEAKCYKLRNQPDMYQQAAQQARQSFEITHPRVRRAIAAKQRYLDRQAKPGDGSSTPVRNGATLDFDPRNVELELERHITQARSGVTAEYVNPLVEADYNTLILIWSGQCPSKRRAGKYGEKTLFVLNQPPDNRYEVAVNDLEPVDAVQGVCDVSFQATTRGGRLMDNVLESQAQFKSFTGELGDSLMDHADDVSDMRAQAVIFAVGLIAKGISKAANPAADIRQWQTLPDTLQVLPLCLDPGEYACTVDEFMDFARVGERKVTFTVSGEDKLTVVVVIPNRKQTEVEERQVTDDTARPERTADNSFGCEEYTNRVSPMQRESDSAQ